MQTDERPHCRLLYAEREPTASSSPEYDKAQVAAYASSRMPACYAVLYRVFDELHLHLPQFSPRTMLDFGSGPGTAIWAARQVGMFLNRHQNTEADNMITCQSIAQASVFEAMLQCM